jgi:CheY-like chemotaxis protein
VEFRPAAASFRGYSVLLVDDAVVNQEVAMAMLETFGCEVKLAGNGRIALTANVAEDDRAACLAAGMDDYVGKPFDLRQLGEKLERWLVKRAS